MNRAYKNPMGNYKNSTILKHRMTFPDLANVWANNSGIINGTNPFYFDNDEYKTAVTLCQTNARVKYRGDDVTIPQSIWNIMTVEKTDKKHPSRIGNKFTLYGASIRNVVVDFDKRTIAGSVGLEKMNVQVTRDAPEVLPGGYLILTRLAYADPQWSTLKWQEYGGQIARGATYQDMADSFKRSGVDLEKEPVELSWLVMEIENQLQHRLYSLPTLPVTPKIKRPRKLNWADLLPLRR